ncbi:MAG TPA: hypothetical protein DHV96_05910 [Lachnospiraceae bacterium]|nr:hypothetical protein [Lachnospiraceae bacterium]
MISIVVVVNKNEIYKEWLKKSLTDQSIEKYEIIEVNNFNNEYKSLSKLYNNAIDKCSGNWIMFAHQDVRFLNNSELENIENKLNEISSRNDRIKLFGVAGVKEGKNAIGISSIFHGEDKRGGDVNAFNGCDCQEVQTVDACCFFIKKEDINEYRFDTKLNGFHMVVEELCLRIRENGESVVVIPCNLWHLSDGKSLDSTYYRETIKVVKSHKNISFINTTSFRWRVNRWLCIKLRYFQLRNYIHHKLIK